MELEGYNPGWQVDCDNINYYSVTTSLPNDYIAAKTGSCPGDNSSIKEQIDVHVKAHNNNIVPNIVYYIDFKFSKTYLYDTLPDWREVNLTWEENNGAYGGGDWWQAKLKYDIRGSHNGGSYVTNGQYVEMCVNPTDMMHITTCP